MRTETIEFPVNGGSAPGYLVRPDSDDARPSIVVIQEWWGVNDHIKDVTQRVAQEGYVALAPDLYHGKTVTEPNDAQKAAMEMDRDRAIKEINAAGAYLIAQLYTSPKWVGVIGFCMGGGLALHVAAINPDVAAVAAFYGGGAPKADAFVNSSAAVLDIVGDQDRTLPSIQELDEGYKKYSFPHELIIYPGGQHAFFNDTRKEVYNPAAAQDAWRHTLDWFRTYLV